MKLIIAFLMFFSGSNAFSQATSEATAKPTSTPNSSGEASIWEKIKKAPIGFTVLNTLTGNTDATSITGLNNLTELNLSYTHKFTPKNSLQLFVGASLSADKVTSDATYDGTGLTFSRNNLLTQEHNGINLDSSITLKVSPGGGKNDGYSLLRFAASRTFNPIFRNSFEVRWYEFGRKSSQDKLVRRQLRAYYLPGFQISEKLSFNPSFIFVETIKGPTTKDENSLNFNPTLDYEINPKFLASFGWDAYPMKSGDNIFFAPRWYSTAGVVLQLYYSIL